MPRKRSERLREAELGRVSTTAFDQAATTLRENTDVAPMQLAPPQEPPAVQIIDPGANLAAPEAIQAPSAGDAIEQALTDEVGSYEDNVREMQECRRLKKQLTETMLNAAEVVPDKNSIDLMKATQTLITARETAALHALKTFNSKRLNTDLKLPTVRIEIVDYHGETAPAVGTL